MPSESPNRSNQHLSASFHTRLSGPAPGYKKPLLRPLTFDDVYAPRTTHYLFRFPAKFHPPVAHCLLRRYSQPGQTVLDPFCGSGTLLLAASIEKRHAIGCDVDPISVFVSSVKSQRIEPNALRNSWFSFRPQLEAMAQPFCKYETHQYLDISQEQYQDVLSREQLWVPNIPNLYHWFRKCVILDLARLRVSILSLEVPKHHKDFFLLIFAAIIRNSSNADPVPVSGLEVTSHMKKREAAGRKINAFELFISACEKGISSVEEFWNASSPNCDITVKWADAACTDNNFSRKIDVVITSPPYHNAVDYYRRHQLEMYWLGFTKDHAGRLELLHRYIGRTSVRKADPRLLRKEELGTLSRDWYSRMNSKSPKRATAFLHYIIAMKDVFSRLSKFTPLGGSVVFVVGNSRWNGYELPTSDLFAELAGPPFSLTEHLSYPLQNRYMSYGRHNGADIRQEFVLVFRNCNQ